VVRMELTEEIPGGLHERSGQLSALAGIGSLASKARGERACTPDEDSTPQVFSRQWDARRQVSGMWPHALLPTPVSCERLCPRPQACTLRQEQASRIKSTSLPPWTMLSSHD
jgi:hypothetical protein